jgi:hypothetical protein
MQIGFQFVGGVPGVPMRLLQDAGAMDLPIEGASSIPFPESVASTITLRIWVRIPFAPLAVLYVLRRGCVLTVAGICTVRSTNDHAKGYWPTYAF